MIRVVIADDQAVVRGGLRMILESEQDIEVVGEAADGRKALDRTRDLDPDVLLMDIRMPNLSGIEATRRLTTAGGRARVLVLTTYDLDENVYDALKAGAAGFLVKTESPARLVHAVRVVAAGEALLAPEITRRLVDRFVTGLRPNTPAPPELEELTARELEVLKLVVGGLSNAEIAETLFVSDGTVKTHVARILSKLELRDRVQVVVFAYESRDRRARHAFNSLNRVQTRPSPESMTPLVRPQWDATLRIFKEYEWTAVPRFRFRWPARALTDEGETLAVDDRAASARPRRRRLGVCICIAYAHQRTPRLARSSTSALPFA